MITSTTPKRVISRPSKSLNPEPELIIDHGRGIEYNRRNFTEYIDKDKAPIYVVNDENIPGLVRTYVPDIYDGLSMCEVILLSTNLQGQIHNYDLLAGLGSLYALEYPSVKNLGSGRIHATMIQNDDGDSKICLYGYTQHDGRFSPTQWDEIKRLLTVPIRNPANRTAEILSTWITPEFPKEYETTVFFPFSDVAPEEAKTEMSLVSTFKDEPIEFVLLDKPF